MLTDIQVVEIYERKIALLSRSMSLPSGDSVSSSLPIRGKSESVAKLYGVSSRTIRDIWNRQTWGITTRHLWDQESTYGFDASKSVNCKVQNHFAWYIYSLVQMIRNRRLYRSAGTLLSGVLVVQKDLEMPSREQGK